jgi:riboflavin synthase
MFTGLITHIGKIKKVEKHNGDISVCIETSQNFCESIKLGDSIAVDGVCLTVVDFTHTDFTVDVSMETISCTTFSSACEGLYINLEKCLTLSTPIGGHLMTGHVHGVGVIRSIYQDGRAKIFELEMPEQLMKYFAPKGTVALNGISLTVNFVGTKTIKISCIPHTLEKTTLQYKQPGDRINIEVDVLMLYLDRLLTHDSTDDVRLLDIDILQRLIGVPRTEH